MCSSAFCQNAANSSHVSPPPSTPSSFSNATLIAIFAMLVSALYRLTNSLNTERRLMQMYLVPFFVNSCFISSRSSVFQILQCEDRRKLRQKKAMQVVMAYQATTNNDNTTKTRRDTHTHRHAHTHTHPQTRTPTPPHTRCTYSVGSDSSRSEIDNCHWATLTAT